MKDIFIIKRNLVTEKATLMQAGHKYVFMVKPSANKSEIKKAVKELYKVDVLDVNTVNIRGKSKRFGFRKSAPRGYKKAVVTIKTGQKIDIK